MKVFICDRCRQEYQRESRTLNEEPNDRSVKLGISLPLPIILEGKIFFRNTELCGDCTSDLSAWIGTRPK